MPIQQAIWKIGDKHADKYRLTANDPERAEYFFRVQWLDAVAKNRAVN